MDPLVTSRGRQPLYTQVAATLRKHIESGAVLEGDYLPSERELAQRLGASRQTIRLAVDELIKQGLIVAAPRRGNRVMAAQQDPPNPQSGLTALMIYSMARGNSAAIFSGCHLAMQAAGYHLIVCETAPNDHAGAGGPGREIRSVIERGVDGVLAYAEPTDEHAAVLREAVEAGALVVQIDRRLPELDCDYVGVENGAAARGAVGHLLELGHRRIGFLGNHPEASTVTERREGYLAALAAAGLAPAPELVASLEPGRDAAPAYRAVAARWLALPDPPTAVFAVNDTQAHKFVEALKAEGCGVPDAMSVVGFDNQLVASVMDPGLTTVAQPFFHIGRMAGQMLIDRIRGDYLGGPRRLMLPTQLVVRGSTAPPLTPR